MAGFLVHVHKNGNHRSQSRCGNAIHETREDCAADGEHDLGVRCNHGVVLVRGYLSDSELCKCKSPKYRKMMIR